MLMSNRDQYGTVAISIHWLSAILILALLGSGFLADNATDPAAKAAFLRFHLPAGIVLLLLTLFRIVWWRFDKKPEIVKGAGAWQDQIARAAHVAFYIVILGMIASGIGMMVLSSAAPVIFGAPGALPNFGDHPPRVPHGLGAFLLAALLVLHTSAAIYHQIVLRDGLLQRMWYGRLTSSERPE
jgi:cytochrome b561